MRISLDAMGGDHGAPCVVEGARMALEKDPDLEVALVGQSDTLEKVLLGLKKPLPKGRYEIVPASQVVDMCVSAKESLRMKDSSIQVAARLVKEGKAHGLVSAGSTAAANAATLFTWRQLKGIHRPGIATHLPTKRGHCIFLDMGGTVDCKPRHLVHFAIMGNVYSREIIGVKNPRIGLLSVGEEQSKGNELTIQTYELLSQARHLNFVGNAEGRHILSGDFDVVIADGFVGNVVLKFAESLAGWMMSEFRDMIDTNIFTKLAGLMMRPKARKLKKKIDYAEYGGAPLMGLNGYCIICHGRSSSLAICNALIVAKEFAERDVNIHIQEDLELNSHILRPPQTSNVAKAEPSVVKT